MYSFIASQTSSSVDVWNWFIAAQQVRAAIAAVDDAAAEISALAADTRWDSDGVRALRELLLSLHARCRTESAELHDRCAEIDRAGVA